MHLLLQDTDSANVKKLMDYARQLDLDLSLVDNNDNVSLQGKPLSVEQLKSMIEAGCKAATICMESAHQILRQKFQC